MWNSVTLEVQDIFHDQIGKLVSEVMVLQDMNAVEVTLEVVRQRYITEARELKLPILFLFNLTDQTIGGLHYSGMIACADKKGVRWFEPARGGIRERNLPMARRVLQFLAGNSSELNVGAVDDRPGELENHCPPQANGSEQDGMLCGHTLRAAMLHHLSNETGDGTVVSAGPAPQPAPAAPAAAAGPAVAAAPAAPAAAVASSAPSVPLPVAAPSAPSATPAPSAPLAPPAPSAAVATAVPAVSPSGKVKLVKMPVSEGVTWCNGKQWQHPNLFDEVVTDVTALMQEKRSFESWTQMAGAVCIMSLSGSSKHFYCTLVQKLVVCKDSPQPRRAWKWPSWLQA